MERLSRLLVGHLKWNAVAVLIVTAVMSLGLASLKFEDGIEQAFRSQHPAYQSYLRFAERFGLSPSQIAVQLTLPDLTEPRRISEIHDFALELATLDDVNRLASIFNLRTRPNDDMPDEAIFGTDLADRQSALKAIDAAIAHPLNKGRLISDDGQHLLFVLFLESAQLDRIAAALEQARGLASSYFSQSDVSVTFAGTPVLRTRIIADIIRDQTVINAFGGLAGFALCLLFFRGLLPALIAGVPALIALSWVLGLLGHTGIGINTLTNTLPVLIMVLAFADSMHLTYEMRRLESTKGLSRSEAVVQALKVAGPACFMTSLTTGIAFASLLISQSELVRSFAVAGMIAVMITFVAVVVINPTLALMLSRFETTRGGAQPLWFPALRWQKALTRIMGLAKSLSAIGLIVLFAAFAMHMTTMPRFSILENVYAEAPQLQAHHQVEETFSPLSSIDVVVPFQQDEPELTPETLARLRDVHQALASTYGEKRVVSAWDIARWINPDDALGAGSFLADAAFRANDETLGALISKDQKALRLAVLTPNLNSDVALEREEEISSLISAVDDGAYIAGSLVMGAHVSTHMIGDLNLSFLGAAALSGLIIGIWCRSVAVGVVALVVNVLPITLAGSSLNLSGQGLQFASGLALTIAFGIAVDDTLHALNRVRPQLLAGRFPDRAGIAQAFETVTPVLFATTIILVGGLLGTLASNVPTIGLFGLVSMAVLVIALIVDIVLLPALLTTIAARRQ